MDPRLGGGGGEGEHRRRETSRAAKEAGAAQVISDNRNEWQRRVDGGRCGGGKEGGWALPARPQQFSKGDTVEDWREAGGRR